MTREIIAYQRLSLDDAIDATELHAEAVMRGDMAIASYRTHADMDSMRYLLGAWKADEFMVYSLNFFKAADSREYKWKFEGAAIRFMSAIKDYFNKSGADVVYIHFR